MPAVRRPVGGDLGRALSGALPGLVLGALFAQILFFLNPHLPFTPATSLRAMTFYGLSGAAASLAGVLLASRASAARAARLLPWGLTLALALGALLGWSLPARFAFYLPPGINRRLLKAAVWLSLSAVVGFYTALLHTVGRRPYGRRSRLAFVLLVLGSLYALAERRGAFPPARETMTRPTLVEREGRPSLLVVGLDGATLDAVLPLAEQGVLPFFARLLEGGTSGRLAALDPARFGPLWTTLDTGKLPYRHGVVDGRTYAAPGLGGRALDLLPSLEPFRSWAKLGARGRPVDAQARRALALWESLAHLGLPVSLVGWPLSSPLPPGLRRGLSDRYFADPSLPGEAQPAEFSGRAALFRVAPAELAEALPAAPGPEGRREALEALAGDLWRLSLCSYLLDEEGEAGAIFVLLPGLRPVSRRYWGGYDAVEFEGLQRSPYAEAAALVEGYHRRLDVALAELWQRREEPALLAVVSAHGTAAASGWRRLRAELSLQRSLEGHFAPAPDGLLLLYGEGIAPGGRLVGARLVDVVPTLLYALGLPVARDLDGQVLVPAFTAAHLARHPMTFVPTYEALRASTRGSP